MIDITSSYGKGYRLLDTNTAKYVASTPENRLKAMFFMIVKNEARKQNKTHEYRYSVKEMAEICAVVLNDSKSAEKLTNLAFEKFLYLLDRNIGIKKLLKDENFLDLSKKVLTDQQKQETSITKENVRSLIKEYKYYDKKIFKDEKEMKL